MTYEHIEKVLAEIIVEVTGEPRIGRFERTVAKSALARLRECGMALATDREVGSHDGHKIVERPTTTSAEVPRSCTTCEVEIGPRVRDA